MAINFCEDFFMNNDKFITELVDSFQRQIDRLQQQIIKIPESNDYKCNRYSTDDEHVLHLWKDNESYDIRIKKDKNQEEVKTIDGYSTWTGL